MKRLFIAIDLRDQATVILQTLDTLRQANIRGRYIRSDQLHLTLQFLGEQPAASITRLHDVLMHTAAQIAPFSLTLSGLGTFGPRSDLIWLGVADQQDCRQLHRVLTRCLTAYGFSIPPRSFQPHITLVRQAAVPDDSPDRRIQPIRLTPIELTVRRIDLMESRLEQGRRRYVPLVSAPLLVAGRDSC